MKLTLVLVLISSVCGHCLITSSFWAPLFDPSILNYKVDLRFDPEDAKRLRADYAKKNGFRGEALIADLGNGRGPPQRTVESKAYGDVKFYYTYPRAKKIEN